MFAMVLFGGMCPRGQVSYIVYLGACLSVSVTDNLLMRVPTCIAPVGSRHDVIGLFTASLRSRDDATSRRPSVARARQSALSAFTHARLHSPVKQIVAVNSFLKSRVRSMTTLS